MFPRDQLRVDASNSGGVVTLLLPSLRACTS